MTGTIRMLVFALAVGAAVAPVHGQESLDEEQEQDKVRLASELEYFGLQNNHALALITAASLYKSLSIEVLQRDRKVDVEGKTVQEGSTVDIDSLLDRAKAVTTEDSIRSAAEHVGTGTRGQYYPGCYWEYYCSPYGGCWYRRVCW